MTWIEYLTKLFHLAYNVIEPDTLEVTIDDYIAIPEKDRKFALYKSRKTQRIDSIPNNLLKYRTSERINRTFRKTYNI